MAAAGLLEGVCLDKSNVLGEGAFGVVYRGKFGDAPVAIKTIKASSPAQAAELEATLLEEAAVWASVQHPNVVQFYGVHKGVDGALYLVSELMDGSVEALLHEEGERVCDGEDPLLDDYQKLTMCLHVVCALRRLHQLGILHSDLAARNVLYKRTMDGGYTFKVTDFGLATVGTKGTGSASASRSYELLSREKLPIRWCAPEVLKRQLYSVEADVWSMGVYMWEVFSLGELPYGLHMTNADLFQKITPAKSTFRLTAPDDCPEEVYELMAKCWVFGRKKRILLPDLDNAIVSLRGQLPQPKQSTTHVQQPAVPAAPASTAAVPPATTANRVTEPIGALPVVVHGGDASEAAELLKRGLKAKREKDYRQAVELLYKAATMGNAAAQGQLGDCYAEGLGVEENYDVALQWYREGAAKGDAVSKTGMGYAYAHGLGGVARDEREAKRLFVAASNDYEPKALYCLGWLYDHGMGSILRNKKEAVLYYRRAAVLGHGRAMAHLADCYYFGTGVEKSAKEAMAWYTKAAKTDALLGENIGFRYLRGTMGMEKNTYNAIQILKIAAEGGSADACLELGKRYGAGDGVLKDADTAADYYRRGAELGNEACAAALKQEQLFEY